MANPVAAWPPTASNMYLPVSPHRPVMQGDVFENIPFAKGRSAGDPDKDPNVTIERRLVAVLGYPCDIYNDGKLVKVQTVAPVTSAAKAGIPDSWAGSFNYAPLPDLLGDGELYAGDLRVAANIDASYLVKDRRVRSLSRFGWAVFRQRIAMSATRAVVDLDMFDQIGSETWEELTLWQRWCDAGRDEVAFQKWLDVADPNLSGFTRRAALDRGQVQMVRVALEAAL